MKTEFEILRALVGASFGQCVAIYCKDWIQAVWCFAALKAMQQRSFGEIEFCFDVKDLIAHTSSGGLVACRYPSRNQPDEVAI